MNRGVVEALFAHDPSFVAFAKNVVGVDDVDTFIDVVANGRQDLIDVAALSKMSPDSADLGTMGGQLRPRKRLRRKDPARDGVTKGWAKDVLAPAVGRATKKALKPLVKPYTGKNRTRNTAGTVIAGATAVKGKQKYDDLDAQGLIPHKQPVYTGEPYQEVLGKADDVDELDAYAEFSKVDSDKRQVFGWASITHMNGKPVVDRQGDFIDLEEVEKSAYNYVVNSRVGGSQHRRDGDRPFHAADLIESIVFTPEKMDAMGLPSEGQQGWWVGFKVNDEDTWQDVKAGRKTGFSVHGRGRRHPVEGDLIPEGTSDV